jgi:hypothetical protein
VPRRPHLRGVVVNCFLERELESSGIGMKCIQGATPGIVVSDNPLQHKQQRARELE